MKWDIHGRGVHEDARVVSHAGLLEAQLRRCLAEAGDEDRRWNDIDHGLGELDRVLNDLFNSGYFHLEGSL